MRCLETNEVCSNTNKRCKECKLDDCKEVLQMIDIQEKNYIKEQLQRLKKNLPEQCKNCSFLEVINLDKMEVRCFYRVKDKCTLK